jgi:chromo domain-containing protein 1
MGKKAFQVYMEKNEARFNEALRKAEEEEEEEQNAQALSERGRGQKRNRSATIPEDSDDEDNTQILQLAQTERNSPKAAPSDSQDIYNSLFVDSQDPDPLGPPPALIHSDVAGQPSAVRRAPLDQSTDEDQNSCSSEGSDDSSMGELAKGSKKTTSQKKGSESLNENGREIGRSASSTRSPGEKIKLSPVKPTRRQSNPIFPVLIQKPTLSRTQTTPSQKAASTSGNPQQNARRLSAPAAQAVATMSRKDSNPSRKKAAGSQIVTASLMTGATAESSSAAQQPPILAASSSMRRSGTQMKSAIRLTNEPKTKLRKEWQSDKHFNKLKFRHLADLKSRREGTPDIAALEFVGARPPGLVKPRAPDPDDNPYGRPEAGSRRMRDSDVDEYQGGNSLEENIPLQDWDENKVPLICASWRLSSNCPYGRQACKFMHRDQDENGRDLPIGDINGVVPPKYRRPPLTCIFWLDNPAGCHKSAEKCDYAHSNTGWRPKDTAHKDEVIQIDPNILPCSESSIPSKYAHGHVPLKHVDGYVPPKDRVPPLTCIFWLDLPAGCTKQDAECEYAHRNTGWRIKDRTHRDKVVQIDPNLLPYSERQTEPYLPTKRMDRFVSTSVPTYTAGYVPPKNRNPALTCKYWLDAPFGCRKPDAECEFAHRNTGWFPNDTGTGQAVQIDRNVLPFSERTTKGSSRSQTIGQIDKRKHHPSELTCWFWMHDQCRFKSDTCMYQHYDTGILADPPSVTLNPKTCHFWAQGKCKLTSEKCKFQHYDSSTKNPSTSFTTCEVFFY